MPDARKRIHWKAWLFLLLILYPLSWGPVVFLYSHNLISENTMLGLRNTVYRPLVWFALKFDGVRHLANWYAEFWMPPE
jgi:hypothetical protein